ncbi:MAG: hypothetical protein HC802_19805, partial [Caldilineaceae bacterium]|nr:hypothetical protein [Caldilineaceae bacterium]
MIDLAPNHKLGMEIANPVLLAGGVIGYGEASPRGNSWVGLGGVVIGPIMRRSRAGSAPPRIAETNGGVVMANGMQNRGIAATIKNFAKLWPKLGCPVIAQLADTQVDDVERVASHLTSAEGLSA